MPNDKLEAVGNTRASRRTVLKGLLVGLGAGVLVQAAGGVTTFARSEQEKPGGDEKVAKKKTEKEGDGGKKLEKNKSDKSDSKSKNEKKKTEEPKQQHKK